MAKFKIPGVSFSLNRALGITQMKQMIARETGVPISKAGIERKVGKSVFFNRGVHSMVPIWLIIMTVLIL